MLAVPSAPAAAGWYKRALGATELWNLGSVVGLEIEGAPFFLHEPTSTGFDSPAAPGTTTVRNVNVSATGPPLGGPRRPRPRARVPGPRGRARWSPAAPETLGTMPTAQQSFRALGSTAIIAVTAPEALPLARVRVDAVIAAFDAACSRFRADSEITALGRAGGAPTVVSEVLFDAVSAGVRAAQVTDGDVDPTLRLDLLARLQTVEEAGNTRNLFEMGSAPMLDAAGRPIVHPIITPKPPARLRNRPYHIS